MTKRETKATEQNGARGNENVQNETLRRPMSFSATHYTGIALVNVTIDGVKF